MKWILRKTMHLALGVALLAAPMITFAMPGVAIAAPVAQDGTLDEGTLAAIQKTAVTLYGAFGGGDAPLAAVSLPDDPEPAPEPTPEPADEPTDPTGEVETGEMVVYTSDEFEIAFPANWEVEQQGAGFSAEETETGLMLQIENMGEDVPGLLMVPLFEGQSELFVRELGEGAEITGIERLTIGAEELPALRLRFANVPNPGVGTMDGVIYIIAAGRDGYALYAGAEELAWESLAPVVDAIVADIQINPERITLQRAGDAPLTVASEDGAYSVDLPSGWMGSITGDDTLGIIFVDPELSIVGAAGASPEEERDDPMLLSLTEGLAGDMDDATMEDIAQAIIDGMNLGGNDEADLDQSFTAILPANSAEGLGILRVAGNAPIMEGASLPFMLYISVYPTRAGAFVVFGEGDDILPLETEILTIIDSLQFGE